jgi:hypothetical protein
MHKFSLHIAVLLVLTSLPAAGAGSKLLATGGATGIEGGAGGGIVPWAVINGYGSSAQWSLTGAASQVGVDDFTLNSRSISLSYDNKYEFSLGRQQLQLDSMGGELNQQIIGLKYKIAGELLYTAMPQISLGLQLKKQLDFAVPAAVGARDDRGTDLYLAASKVWLDAIWGRNLLLNATLRATKGLQTGLLGFGTGSDSDYQYVGEFSAVLLLNPQWALGAEFKQKPDELAFAREDHWRDLFVACFINKHLSVVAGHVDLGSIATLRNQTGYYLALESTWAF